MTASLEILSDGTWRAWLCPNLSFIGTYEQCQRWFRKQGYDV